ATIGWLVTDMIPLVILAPPSSRPRVGLSPPCASRKVLWRVPAASPGRPFQPLTQTSTRHASIVFRAFRKFHGGETGTGGVAAAGGDRVARFHVRHPYLRGAFDGLFGSCRSRLGRGGWTVACDQDKGAVCLRPDGRTGRVSRPSGPSRHRHFCREHVRHGLRAGQGGEPRASRTGASIGGPSFAGLTIAGRSLAARLELHHRPSWEGSCHLEAVIAVPSSSPWPERSTRPSNAIAHIA